MDDLNLNNIQILLIIIIPALITGIPSLISTIGAWKDKRKRRAEALADESTAAEKVSSAWEKIVEDLQKRIDKMDERQNKSDERQNKSDEEQRRLNGRLNRQRKRINYLEDGVQILIRQLKELGVEPNFILEDEDDKEEKGE